MKIKITFLIFGLIFGLTAVTKFPLLDFEFNKTVSEQLNIPLWTVKSGTGVGLSIVVFSLFGFLLGWLLEKVIEK